MRTNTLAALAMLGVALAGCLALTWFAPASASDHTDSPLVENDPSADIADVYAFTNAGNLVTILTYGAGVTTPLYDPTVLYSINIDTNSDNAPDHQIHVRFGANGTGQFGVQASNVPGAGGPLVGAVQTTLTGGNGAQLFAGMVDDPFFFDSQGLADTFATSTISFNNTRDGFAGLNVMAIVLEMQLADISPGLAPMRIWGTTGRE